MQIQINGCGTHDSGFVFSFQEADMLFAPLAPTMPRTLVQDFSRPFFFEYTTLAYKKLQQTNKMDLYAKPFKLAVGFMAGSECFFVFILFFFIFFVLFYF